MNADIPLEYTILFIIIKIYHFIFPCPTKGVIPRRMYTQNSTYIRKELNLVELQINVARDSTNLILVQERECYVKYAGRDAPSKTLSSRLSMALSVHVTGHNVFINYNKNRCIQHRTAKIFSSPNSHPILTLIPSPLTQGS